MRRLLTGLFVVALLVSCASAPESPGTAGAGSGETAVADLQPASLEAGEMLEVVATTSLVGDAVRRIGGDSIALTVLLPAGADPHNYVATPRDRIALGNADVVFVNGLGLEQALLPALAEGVTAAIVSVNQDVTPLASFDKHDVATREAGSEKDGGGEVPVDPHTWQDARNVALWATSVAAALARLDPANAATYTEAGEAYAAELLTLHEELVRTYGALPLAQRIVVTDHEDLRYFAEAYGFTVVGSVVPSFSTLATVSAQDRSTLQEQIQSEGVRAILVGTTVNPRIAEQLADDTGVAVVRLYTDSLSAADGPAANYAALMRSNATALVDALK